MIIAIDGPAASGKGTLGRRLADHFGYHHLDTGLLYRAVAAALLEAGDPLDDEAIAVSTTSRIPLDGLDAPSLSTHAIGEAASRVAVMPGLRAALVDRQRAFAARLPGAVLDGRDVGTVICPDADVKIFLVASPQARARRRAAQLGLHSDHGYQRVLEDILRRDERDTNRAVAPLRPAADAHLLDTTDLDIEAAFQAALSMIERAAERS